MPAKEQEQHAARGGDGALRDTRRQNPAPNHCQARAERMSQNAAGGDWCGVLVVVCGGGGVWICLYYRPMTALPCDLKTYHNAPPTLP